MVILMSFEDSECDDSPVTDGYAGTFQGGWDGEEPTEYPSLVKGAGLKIQCVKLRGFKSRLCQSGW